MDRAHSKTHSVRLCYHHRCSRDVESVPPTPLTEASKNGRPDTLPSFSMPCRAEIETPAPKQFVVGNHRARKRQARMDKLPDVSPESNMGRVFEGLGIPHVRLAKVYIDLSTDEGEIQLQSQMEGCEKPNLWAAIPCTSGSAWQRLNKAKLGSQFKKKLKQKVKESRELISRFRRHAETLLHQKGSVSFEWPRDDDVAAFFREHTQVFTPVTFHGCALGLKDSNGCPIKKPWKVMTSNSTLAGHSSVRMKKGLITRLQQVTQLQRPLSIPKACVSQLPARCIRQKDPLCLRCPFKCHCLSTTGNVRSS